MQILSSSSPIPFLAQGASAGFEPEAGFARPELDRVELEDDLSLSREGQLALDGSEPDESAVVQENEEQELLTDSDEEEENLNGLTDAEQAEVDQLKDRDAEVRAHEQRHLVVAGQYAIGGPTYTYQTGPDGRRYAVGGEVSIDISEVPNDPEATIKKMEQVRRAALAPAEPSSQDYRLAAQAANIAQQARLDLLA